ncbi:unnamed protein product [Musa acuminata subsp. malaccensis]|uniref:protein-serine/threonine phosphatase n=1 Tax=Musa acuminata subsp. malaccensis TaxID=214687 RepID=A0A804KV02_MUSAM|nr:PREDICTED: probable protein phosphatase 2C 74 [Musa acuminata subsp. malaccensis]CAG1853196.1 unnamed protein product [Musa acuminata subsp. malaccensis]
MVDPDKFRYSLCSRGRLLQVLRKYFSIVPCSSSPRRTFPAPAFSWKRVAELPVAANKRPNVSSDRKVHPVEDEITGLLVSGTDGGVVLISSECKQPDSVVEHASSLSKVGVKEEKVQENKEREEKSDPPVMRVVESTLPKTRRRPARIVIPKPSADTAFSVVGGEQDGIRTESEAEGSAYCVVSRRGQRHRMEDGYGVIPNIHGDDKQAFFGVFDGHGGRAAVDFVSEKLGKNILTALEELQKEENQMELAIKEGFLTTDREFLSQGVSSGACAVTVLLKDGELHAANVGDCRVVISRKGVADALTDDHRAGREDERNRIENSGGYVTCRNGMWRVQDSLAVSRAIGDMNMKEWIISEPEIRKIHLTTDCESLILASDGLWDKVTNQEAVDVVSKHSSSMKSCKELIEISNNKGNRDDITVMVIDLQKFMHSRG